MKIGKILISLLLLLTYSLSYAHSLIPHCHGLDCEVHGTTHGVKADSDQKHHHHQNENPYSGHFEHDEHCDEDCTFPIYIVGITADELNKNFKNKGFVAVLLSFFKELELSSRPSDYERNCMDNFLSPDIKNAPHRGPPTPSC